ncbi:keratinocyte-associated protein 3 [Cyanistes caeruleus]|uniref:keratinocyte-associated protein 3 n=1 Tax=Cyanistes caeruleus TaxID=156563 RepID=UPI000CDA3E5D|nr:keratinocyte-associated protein 3 [Cyanistes caeruleus]
MASLPAAHLYPHPRAGPSRPGRGERWCVLPRGSISPSVPGPSVSPSSCQSHPHSCRLQHWTLLSISVLNCLLSTACSAGLALAVALTVHSRGTHLVRGCNSSALPLDARAAIATNDCPFNTTRIYDTALALWFPSLLLAAAEAVLSGRCCLVALVFQGIGPCAHSYGKEQMARPSTAMEKPLRERQQLLAGLAESPV